MNGIADLQSMVPSNLEPNMWFCVTGAMQILLVMFQVNGLEEPRTLGLFPNWLVVWNMSLIVIYSDIMMDE